MSFYLSCTEDYINLDMPPLVFFFIRLFSHYRSESESERQRERERARLSHCQTWIKLHDRRYLLASSVSKEGEVILSACASTFLCVVCFLYPTQTLCRVHSRMLIPTTFEFQQKVKLFLISLSLTCHCALHWVNFFRPLNALTVTRELAPLLRLRLLL